MEAYKNRSYYNFTDKYPQMYPGKQARSVTFIVTHDCNLRCTYCYEHNKSNERMSFETAKRCVDMLFREDARNSDYINDEVTHGVILEFIGGEPLLEIDLIDQIMDYFRETALSLGHRWATQYMISMSTNGMLYYEPKVQEFLHKNNGRVSISVTVDGNKETHDSCRVDCNGCGSYDRAAKAFRDILDRHSQKGTKFTISPYTVDKVFEAARDMVGEFGIDTFFLNCVYEEGWTNEHASTLYYQLKRLTDWIIDTDRESVMLSIFDPFIGKPLPDTETQNWCGGTGKMLAFDVDGTVYPCLRYAPLSIGDHQPLLRIGDMASGIAVLPKDKETVDMLNAITRQSQSTDECINCPIASGCGWCSAYNYEVSGTPDKRVTFICPTHKARVMAASYYWNSIYRKQGSPERFALNIPRDWALEIVPEDEYDMLTELASV